MAHHDSITHCRYYQFTCNTNLLLLLGRASAVVRSNYRLTGIAYYKNESLNTKKNFGDIKCLIKEISLLLWQF